MPTLNSKVIAINEIKKQQPHSGKELMLGILWIYLLYFWFECFNPITNTVMNKTTCHTMEEWKNAYTNISAVLSFVKSIPNPLSHIWLIFSLSFHFRWSNFFHISMGNSHIYFVFMWFCLSVCLLVCPQIIYVHAHCKINTFFTVNYTTEIMDSIDTYAKLWSKIYVIILNGRFRVCFN